MGRCTFRDDGAGELFCSRTTHFAITHGSDGGVHPLNRRATITLPSKAAASGALLASSREDDTPCPSRRPSIFLKRAARGRDQGFLDRSSLAERSQFFCYTRHLNETTKLHPNMVKMGAGAESSHTTNLGQQNQPFSKGCWMVKVLGLVSGVPQPINGSAETIGESCTKSQSAAPGPPPTSLKRLRAGAGTGAGAAPAA